MIKRWSFSLVVGLVYLGVFHLWMVSSRRWIVISGLVATLWLSVLFARAAKGNYFLNRWDQVFHALVILDIFLEAVLIPAHIHVGFYLCAAGFAVVLGGYRSYLSKTKTTESSKGTGIA